ncbi:MAG: anti-sigma factor [Proteobacteria bacterium]|nr:anti-sigma factor [Pseudomonadota bacterium]MBI3496179.1 anti-sigma factor [Pseudomonadota bacterium]
MNPGMDCKEAEEAVHGYVDGELDRAAAARVDAHIRGCAQCRRLYERERQMSASLRQAAERFTAPADLGQRIGAALEMAAKPASREHAVSWRQLGLAASFLLVAVISSALTFRFSVPGETDRQGEEVISGHVRALVANHMTDVASSDQHTVKPWFNGKLDLSPPVVDLAREEFPLVGGRLDYVDGHPVAALVYRHRQHPITLYVWVDGSAGDGAARHLSRRGYNALGWTLKGTVFWAVSDINAEDLQRFAELLKSQA